MMKQTWLLFLLTIALLVGLVFYGIPALINMAIFLGELNSGNRTVEQDDTIAPPPPILDQLPTATSSATLSLTGYAESQALVYLYREANELAETLATSEGTFEFGTVDLVQGNNIFWVTAKDQVGNMSEVSNKVSVLYDTEPPKLIVAKPSDGKEFFGENNRTIEISGFTDSDAEVQVNSYFSVVSGDGSFSTRIRLEEGDNEIKIVARDEAGNVTEESLRVRYSP